MRYSRFLKTMEIKLAKSLGIPPEFMRGPPPVKLGTSPFDEYNYSSEVRGTSRYCGNCGTWLWKFDYKRLRRFCVIRKLIVSRELPSLFVVIPNKNETIHIDEDPILPLFCTHCKDNTPTLLVVEPVSGFFKRFAGRLSMNELRKHDKIKDMLDYLGRVYTGPPCGDFPYSPEQERLLAELCMFAKL